MKTVPPPQVVVSGATGFLGRAIVMELLNSGFHVIALHRRTPVEGLLPPRDGLKTLQIDLASHDAEYRLNCLPSFSAFIHAAGAPKFIGVTESELRCLHVGATCSVASLCSARRARLIHISTAYVSPDANGLLKEAASGPRSGANAYEITKTEAEIVLDRSLHAPLDIVRPAIVCAAHNDPIVDHQASPAAMFLRLARRNRIVIPGDSNTSLAFCDRGDVARFVCSLAENPASYEPRWWNLCGRAPVQLGDLCTEFSRLSQRPVELDKRLAGSRLDPWIPYLRGRRAWDCTKTVAWADNHNLEFRPITADVVAKQLVQVFNQLPGEVAA